MENVADGASLSNGIRTTLDSSWRILKQGKVWREGGM
jgi:hypothetical protein